MIKSAAFHQDNQLRFALKMLNDYEQVFHTDAHTHTHLSAKHTVFHVRASITKLS